MGADIQKANVVSLETHCQGDFRMKKSIIASMFAGIILSTAGMAEAACDIWFDRGADIDRFQKVVVYPISAKSRNNFLWKE